MHLSTTLIATTLLSTALAVPAVTTKLLEPADCRWWPQRSQIFVSSSDDPYVNSLPAQPYKFQFGSRVLSLLAIDFRASGRFAKQIYACSGNSPVIPGNPSQKLSISQDRQNAHILIEAPAEETLVPELYEHYINGVKQEGRFLGAKGLTTWGFRYVEATCNADNATLFTRDSYEVKLQGLPNSPYDSAGYPSEFEGFLKVVQY